MLFPNIADYYVRINQLSTAFTANPGDLIIIGDPSTGLLKAITASNLGVGIGAGGSAHQTATITTNHTFTVSGTNAIFMIIVAPTSTLASFQVGITSSGQEVISNQPVTPGSNVFATSYWMNGNTSLFFQGITSSTAVTIITL